MRQKGKELTVDVSTSRFPKFLTGIITCLRRTQCK